MENKKISISSIIFEKDYVKNIIELKNNVLDKENQIRNITNSETLNAIKERFSPQYNLYSYSRYIEILDHIYSELLKGIKIEDIALKLN